MLQRIYNSLESQVVRLKKISENGTYLHNDMSSRSIMKCNVAMGQPFTRQSQLLTTLKKKALENTEGK